MTGANPGGPDNAVNLYSDKGKYCSINGGHFHLKFFFFFFFKYKLQLLRFLFIIHKICMNKNQNHPRKRKYTKFPEILIYKQSNLIYIQSKPEDQTKWTKIT